jgi:hypothetical protein
MGTFAQSFASHTGRFTLVLSVPPGGTGGALARVHRARDLYCLNRIPRTRARPDIGSIMPEFPRMPGSRRRCRLVLQEVRLNRSGSCRGTVMRQRKYQVDREQYLRLSQPARAAW